MKEIFRKPIDFSVANNFKFFLGKLVLFGVLPIVGACEDIKPTNALSVIKMDAMQKLGDPGCPAVIELLKHMSSLTIFTESMIDGVQGD